MLKDKDIICLSSADWDNPYWTNQQHIMWRLARENRVLYIESLGLRRPALHRKDILRILKRLKNWLRGVRKANEHLFIYSPILLPFYGLDIIRRLNHWFLLRLIKRLLRGLGMTSPILWAYAPNASSFIGRLGEELIVYHCVDKIYENPRVPTNAVKEMERKLLRYADLVFASSRLLFEELRDLNSNTYYLPNTCDFQHFSKARDDNTLLPSDIKKVPRPIIGFIGAISSYKLDFDLIKSIASSRPEWSIVLIGPRGEGEKAVDLSPLKRYKNIFYFGPRRYEELPGYLKAFDVCILPCAINDYTQAMFPMKFFEYLASGKQVVTTDLPSLREFKSFCKVAETPKEFVGKIEDCLREDSATQIRKRIDLAKRYSWERRLEEISTLIQRRLEDQRDAGK